MYSADGAFVFWYLLTNQLFLLLLCSAKTNPTWNIYLIWFFIFLICAVFVLLLTWKKYVMHEVITHGYCISCCTQSNFHQQIPLVDWERCRLDADSCLDVNQPCIQMQRIQWSPHLCCQSLNEDMCTSISTAIVMGMCISTLTVLVMCHVWMILSCGVAASLFKWFLRLLEIPVDSCICIILEGGGEMCELSFSSILVYNLQHHKILIWLTPSLHSVVSIRYRKT